MEVNHKTFAGLRNDVDPERFDAGDLVAAVNVDLDDSGRLSRRSGYSLVAAGGNSLWSDGRICLFNSSGTLTRLHEDYSTSTLGTIGTDPLCYESVNGRVYLSNGTQSRVIDQGRLRTWGLEVPGLPLASQAGGSLPFGRYQFVLTYVREDGQESGAGMAGLIECDGGIAFSSIPVSSDPTVTHKILYLTPQNGDVLYRAAVLENSATSYTWNGGNLATPLATQYLEPAPAGSIVAWHYGRLYVVSGANVFYSQPYGYELFDPRDYLAFDSTVRIFAPVEGGVWVGTDTEIFWLDGTEPAEMQKRPRALVASVAGTLVHVQNDLLPDNRLAQPDARVAVWWTDDGAVAGYPGGTLGQLTRGRHVPPVTGERGTALFRSVGNTNQYLALIAH